MWATPNATLPTWMCLRVCLDAAAPLGPVLAPSDGGLIVARAFFFMPSCLARAIVPVTSRCAPWTG
eukprot:1723479-Rhodomonas_salina.1